MMKSESTIVFLLPDNHRGDPVLTVEIDEQGRQNGQVRFFEPLSDDPSTDRLPDDEAVDK